MPRRTPDEGVKPFEFRTGIGGLPSLGGMYRAGDPATIPPHKHHLLVNMRIRPGGMVTRPGMEEVYDTGVSECIEGLAETETGAGGVGPALVLYPGAENGWTGLNDATFRLIYPSGQDQSWTFIVPPNPPPHVSYSELMFVLAGPAAPDNQTASPVISGRGSFILNGAACKWHSIQDPVDQNNLLWMLLEMPFSARSYKHAHDCLRAYDTWLPDLSQPCPLESYEIGDTGLFRTNLWPGSYPVTTVRAVFWPQSPWPGEGWGPTTRQVTIPERVDDVVTGEAGLTEVLYFIAQCGQGGPNEGRLVLVRWDGVTQTTEYVIPAGYTVSTLGVQQHGPFILGVSDTPGVMGWDFAAVRGVTGSWTVLPAGLDFPAPDSFIRDRVFAIPSRNGNARVVAAGIWDVDPGVDPIVGMWVFEADANDFRNCYCVLVAAPYQVMEPTPVLEGAVVSKQRVYVVTDIHVVSGKSAPAPIDPADRGTVSPSVLTMPFWYDALSFAQGGHWIQVVGGTVYAGGGFGMSVQRFHAVYNADMPPGGARNPVYCTAFNTGVGDPEFEGPYTWESEPGTSAGCLDSVPHEKLDEGFGSEGTIEAV